MLFEVVGDYAKDKFGAKEGNKRLAKANKRFLSFRNSHPGLRLPNIDFLGGSSFVTAFEHRHSMSVRVRAVRFLIAKAYLEKAHLFSIQLCSLMLTLNLSPPGFQREFSLTGFLLLASQQPSSRVVEL